MRQTYLCNIAECSFDRLIVLLRNPVDRAYSHWNHFNQNPEEATGPSWRIRAFERALQEAPSLLENGAYAPTVAAFLKYFDRCQVGIWVSERVGLLGPHSYVEMFRHLGLNNRDIRPPTLRHARTYADSMCATTRASLNAHFELHNEHLRDLLIDTIPEWS